MKEKSIEKDEEILNNIKAYMQENIDKGYHKFVYNDLGYDEKCVDVINAIEHILSDYKRTLKENEHLHREINRRIKLKIENEKIVDNEFISKNKVREIIQKYYDEYEYEKEYRYTLDVEDEQRILRKIEKELLNERG